MTLVGVSQRASPSCQVIYGFAYLSKSIVCACFLCIYWCWINPVRVRVRVLITIKDSSVPRTNIFYPNFPPKSFAITELAEFWTPIRFGLKHPPGHTASWLGRVAHGFIWTLSITNSSHIWTLYEFYFVNEFRYISVSYISGADEIMVFFIYIVTNVEYSIRIRNRSTHNSLSILRFVIGNVSQDVINGSSFIFGNTSWFWN